MRIGLVFLVLAYGLSQFYRAFLAVLTPALQTDLGATPADLALASGVWFLVFAAMQIPVGAALDRVGPRLTAVSLLALGGGGGAIAFALATTPMHITFAMGLIGVGCAPVLMASYYILARSFSPAVFATLAGAIIGFGSLGNIAGSAPLAWAAETYGWRETMYGMAVLALVICALLWVFIKDPPRVETTSKGSVLDVLKMPVMWPILAMMFVNYAPAAGLRGLWAGPYTRDVFAADAGVIGQVTLLMGLAMIAGSFIYGPMDRLFRTRKWVVLVGNSIGVLALIALWAMPERNIWLSAGLLAVVGAAGASFVVLVAHGKAYIPAHLTGRGVTLLNLFGIGGAGVMQVSTGPLHAIATDRYGIVPAYGLLFGFFAILVTAGLICYAFSKDSMD